LYVLLGGGLPFNGENEKEVLNAVEKGQVLFNGINF